MDAVEDIGHPRLSVSGEQPNPDSRVFAGAGSRDTRRYALGHVASCAKVLWLWRTFDVCSLSSNTTGIEVFRGTLEKLEIPDGCKLFTKTAQSTGPENIGPERPLSVILAPGPVHSLTRITLEYNDKIRPQPDRETAFARASRGGGVTNTELSPVSTASAAVAAARDGARPCCRVAQRCLRPTSRSKPRPRTWG